MSDSMCMMRYILPTNSGTHATLSDAAIWWLFGLAGPRSIEMLIGDIFTSRLQQLQCAHVQETATSSRAKVPLLEQRSRFT